MRKPLRLLVILVVGLAALLAGTLNAYASCTSDEQGKYIWDRYYKNLDLTEDVLNDKALGYVNKAYIYVDTCDADKAACQWERRVSFPTMKRGRSIDKKWYYVYRIDYSHPGTDEKIYKYGLGRYASKRMAESRRLCRVAISPGSCTGHKVVKKIKGWSNARSIEASLVMIYTVKHGHCPPGQRTSCR